jgi:hypothetical protein
MVLSFIHNMRIVSLFAFCVFLLTQTLAQQNDYADLLRRCSEHEVAALENPVRFQFLERTEWSWGSETRKVIETLEGRADRIISFNDEPLAPDQQQKQQHRLEKLLKDHDARHDEIHDQQDETKRRIAMARALPDAVLLEFDGREPNGQLRFNFTPNPKFEAKSRETQIYRAMRGTLWIDPVAERLTQVDGELFKDVSFGWGIFGRLYKGGHYQVRQAQLRRGAWRITTLNLDFKGRVFLFNQFKVFRRESSSSFTSVPADMTFDAAVEKLMTMSAASARQ